MPKRHVAGHWLHYRLWGSLAGPLPPIVLLHHGFGHADGWGLFPERLRAATGRAVLVYSRPDCGRSDAKEGAVPGISSKARPMRSCPRCWHRSASLASASMVTATAAASP